MKRRNRTWAMVGNRSAGVRRAEASKLRATRRLASFDRLEPRTLMAANVVEYPLGESGGGAVAITSGFGTDTNLYFTLPNSNNIGVYNPVAGGAVSQYPIPTVVNSSGAIAAGYSGASGITAGADGNIYFLETAANQIGEFNPTTKTFTEYPLLATANAGLTSLTTGPDGNIWFTEFNANKIGVFNVTTHAITEFAVPTAAGEPDGITADPATGTVWFTEFGTNNVGVINATTHVIQDFTAPNTGNLGNAAIAYDSTNQTLYFLETQAKLIAAVNPLTDAFGSTIAGLNDTAQTDQIAVDSSGNLWYTEQTAGQVGIINTTTGTVTKQITASFNSEPQGIALGANGDMWYTTASVSQLHPVSLGGLVQTVVAIPTTTNGSGSSFQASNSNYTATSIVSDANGNLWFAQPGDNSIGEYNLATHTSTLTNVPSFLAGGLNPNWQPQQLALDTSNNTVYFTENQQNGTGSKLGEINTTTGVVTDVASTPTLSAGSQGIAYDNPSSGNGNGDFYFAEETAGHLGQLNPTTGAISDGRTVPLGESQPYGVVADSSGDLWVTMFGSGTVDRFNPATSQWLATPISLTVGSHPEGITLGPDGNLWVAEAGTGKVAVINPNTQTLVTEFAASAAGGITAGADGNVWITQAGAVASITPGTFTETPYAVADATPEDVVAGNDGNLYFTGQGTVFPNFFPNVIGAVTTNLGSQANSLAFTTQPPADVTVGTNFGLVVAVENPGAQIDTFVNNYSPLTGSVTISLGPNAAGATLTGTLTAPVINGVAVFSGLSMSTAGNGYTIQAAYNGLSTATSNPFNVTLAATRLQFTSQPPATLPDGQTFSVSVSAEDANGNVDSSYNGPIVLKLGNNPGNTSFTTLTVGASNGVASFPNLTINQIGIDYTLVASTSSGNLTGATSGGFNVVPGAVTQLVITTEPSANATPATPLSLIIKAEDVNDTLVTSYSGTLTVSLDNNLTGASLLGSVPVNFINGVATVTGLTISKPGIGYTLEATSGNFSAVSSSINVTPAPTSQFILSVLPAGDATAGQTFALTVKAEDAFTNLTTAYTGTIQLSSTDFAVALPSYTFTAFDQGVHTFLIALDTAGAQTITATDVNNTAVTGSTAVTVDPGPTTHFFASATTNLETAGSPVLLTFTAEDADNNPTPNYTGTVALTSSDPNAQLPANVTFTGADAGTKTFDVTLETARNQSVTLTDTNNPAITGSSDVVVSPGPTAQIAIGVTASVTVGTPFKAVFTAEDAFGNLTPTYLGTIHVTSTDPNAVLPANYTFVASDSGVHSLTITAGTVGTPSLVVSDTSNPSISGAAAVTVNPTATTLLLTTSTPSTTYGQQANFSVTVRQLANLAPPTGTVQFSVDGSPIGSPVSLVSGQAAAPRLTSLVAGSHTITATYSGDSTYAAGSTNPVTIGVSQAPLTFTVNTLTRTYGQPNPPLTFSVTGYVNNDTAATAYTGTPILTTLAALSSSPGNFAVAINRGTLASTNYDVSTLIPGTLTVTQAPITVTAANFTRAYGLSNPTFTYTFSGLLNSDLGNVLQGAPSLTTTAVAGSPAGTYAIKVGVGTLSAANYTFSNLVNGTLTVTGQAPAKVGDFDGDGVTDLAVFRPSTAQWMIQDSSGGSMSTQFGDPAHNDIPVPANYLGNGKDQLAVFRPATDQWIIQTSPGHVEVEQFGDPKQGDIPVPGDYEGIGKVDLAVFRPGTDQWIILLSTGKTEILQFGDPKQGDLPVPGDYDGDGKTDLAVFRPTTDLWIVNPSSGAPKIVKQFGDPNQGDIPAPGDYDGDTITDLAVYRPGTSLWIIQESTNGKVLTHYGDPSSGDLPAAAPAAYVSTIENVDFPIQPAAFQVPTTTVALSPLAIAPWSATDPSTTTTTQKPKSNDAWLTALDELAIEL